MADRKIIAVAGATGSQGGGLVRAILDDPDGGFAVRALTRDPTSDKAKTLAGLGAEVVAANVHDVRSLERAMRGAYGAYCVTFYWAHMSPEKEAAEARNLAEAAKAAGVEHVIWSTLEDTRKWVPLTDQRMPTLLRRYKVPHFDVKGQSDKFFTELDTPTTFLLTTFYWDNFAYFGMGPKKAPDGKLALTLPMGESRLAGIAAEDIGRCAYGIFKAGSACIGKTIGISGELLTGAQMAAAFTEVFGREVLYTPVTPEAYRKLGFPGADDLGNMFQFYAEFEDYFARSRDPTVARSLNPELQTFAQWLAQNKSRIPLE